MGNRSWVLILLITVAVCSAAAPAAAQNAVPTDTLTAKAAVAGVAKVQSQSVRLNPTNNVIYTDYVLKFSDVWKGDPSEPYILSRTGGRLGDRSGSLPGHDYELKDGDAIVVFAHPNPQGTNVVIGMHQGLFHVDAGSNPLVHRVLAPPSERRSSLTLQALKEEVFRASGRPWKSSASPVIPPETGKAYGTVAASNPVPAIPPTPIDPARLPPPAESTGNTQGVIWAGVLIIAAVAFVLIRKLRTSPGRSR